MLDAPYGFAFIPPGFPKFRRGDSHGGHAVTEVCSQIHGNTEFAVAAGEWSDDVRYTKAPQFPQENIRHDIALN